METEGLGKRDFLDILEPYRYMNQAIFLDWALGDGRWDHAQGWIHLNAPASEWQVRLANSQSLQSPEGTTH